MTMKTLELSVESGDGSRELTFAADRLICCGWVGRDRAALQAHIDELARLGVPPPTRVPIYMNLTTSLLSSDDEMEVVSPTTSGEVEYVLLWNGTAKWVTVGSDQTDRQIEAHSIVASKQMCGKYVARRCWPYDEVADHWDRLVLRCWITKGGRRTIYQDAPLSAVLPPQELLDKLPDASVQSRGTVLFSGTIPTTSGLVYADSYELELEDPALGRTIRAGYRVRPLGQHV
jgi:hypothetical protein